MILPLVDNNPKDEYKYEIHIYTGLNSNAGTDSSVSMVLAGTDSDTGMRVLKDGKRKVVMLCFIISVQSGDTLIHTYAILIPRFATLVPSSVT